MINRRYFSGALAVLCTTPVGAANRPNMTMHRSPTCGCCGAWAAYIRRAGFSITIVNESDLSPIKSRAGVPDALQSCHTAFIDGYVVEGHVPVEAIEKMLSERPAITGIAVPEMPTGSPGMEIPMMKPEPFKVIAFSQMGSSETFMDYPNGFIAGR